MHDHHKPFPPPPPYGPQPPQPLPPDYPHFIPGDYCRPPVPAMPPVPSVVEGESLYEAVNNCIDRVNVCMDTYNSVMAEFSPAVNLTVEDTLSGSGNEQNIALEFKSLKDFEPEQVAKNIPQLRVLLAMRNLLRDLKSNLLDNATFRRELENILKDPTLSSELRDELAKIAPQENV